MNNTHTERRPLTPNLYPLFLSVSCQYEVRYDVRYEIRYCEDLPVSRENI